MLQHIARTLGETASRAVHLLSQILGLKLMSRLSPFSVGRVSVRRVSVGRISRSLLILLSAPVHAQLVVLQYHHVDASTPEITSVTPEQFEQHLELIEREGMTVVSLPDALRALDNTSRKHKALPDRAVAITFDDAYQSIAEHAAPALEQRGWPYTVFVNTDAVDQGFPDMMSWATLNQRQVRGATLANHTRTHPYLLNTPEGMTPEAFWAAEILGAEQRLEEETGHSHRLFAYPYGEYTPALAQWLQDQGFTAFGQQSGAIGNANDRQLLPRFPASGQYADLDTLTTKLRSLPFSNSTPSRIDPRLSSDAANPPEFTLNLAVNDFHPDQLRCFATGMGAMTLSVSPEFPSNDAQNTDYIQVSMQAPESFQGGRGRYNCTAPSLSESGRFYWFSQLWINTQVFPR